VPAVHLPEPKLVQIGPAPSAPALSEQAQKLELAEQVEAVERRLEAALPRLVRLRADSPAHRRGPLKLALPMQEQVRTEQRLRFPKSPASWSRIPLS
jgi:hypothetical protein